MPGDQASETRHLCRLYKRNWKDESFVPFRALCDFFGDEDVKKFLQETQLQAEEQEASYQEVTHGGRRVFAILYDLGLPHLIINFVVQDQLLGSQLDSLLPFRIERLMEIIGDEENNYHKFYQRQWMFCSPIFKPNFSHRILQKQCVLPFMKQVRKGEGGFGDVFEVELPGTHQGFTESTGDPVKLVVKTFKKGSVRMNEDAAHERQMLSLLRRLRHPHIIHFYAAYAVDDIPSFILDAADYDLFHLLSNSKGSVFTDEVIFYGMSGIASAIDALHNYFSDQLNVRLVGCHYDLKPQNILVRGTQFLLSDFGLSRIKTEAEGSGSRFQGGLADYLAPECQELDSPHHEHMIHRSSDIWSFGCVLAELAVWLQKGPAGVSSFRETRKATSGPLTHHQFHEGGQISKPVSETLTKLLGDNKRQYHGPLQEVIRIMLKGDAKERPKSQEVMIRLFHLYSWTVYEDLSRIFDELFDPQCLWVVLERSRFQAWGWAMGFIDSRPLELRIFGDGEKRNSLYEIHDILKGLREDLNAELSELDCEKPATPTLAYRRAIQIRINNLWGTLTEATVRDMSKKSESFLVERDENLKPLLQSLGEPEQLPLPASLHLKIILKQVSQALEAPTSSGIDKELKQEVQDSRASERLLGGKGIEEMTRSDEPKPTVHLENLPYAVAWLGEPQKLVNRVNGLVCLLKQLHTSGTFPILKCEGFQHVKDTRIIQLIFRFPQHCSKPLTLESLIRGTSMREKRPPLDHVYRLAHTLTEAMSNFHQAGWYHKSIASCNIIFFPEDEMNPAGSITKPYLTGFSYSRGDSGDEYTVGPSQEEEEIFRYQHPDYRKDTRFKRWFDYYSMGIILLELARWRPLSYMVDEKLPPPAVQTHLLKQEVPLVASYLGRPYQDAVRACLDGSLEGANGDSEMKQRFDDEVRKPIERYLALSEAG